ncbi:hypothetical protein [Myxococcus sp. RHSTA-1-4]|uniref:hypothetical protein n=1 Tax=Myxococcus sp. RHSTA-1-4 TaxID=2874601 RepID=UPI001CC0CCCD|nr:hypothetical protein [Myxococcus sp. RHSTA-1-4]MBZ4422186.1 hypothetical protein [Myxococcus sp. RHSTA-1-4]
MFQAAPVWPGSWRQRRRWPWLIYGARPYANGYGFPVFPPRSDAEPYPDEESEVEYEAKRGPLGTTIGTWKFRTFHGWHLKDVPGSPPLPPIPPGGGVYIVVQDKKLLGKRPSPDEVLAKIRADDMLPLYVGETDNFYRRWMGRLRDLYQVGITDPVGRLPPYHRHIHVWFGPIPAPAGPKLRKTVEHAIVRTLIHAKVVAEISNKKQRSDKDLRNRSSFLKFSAIGALPSPPSVSIDIKNLLPPVPWWMQREDLKEPERLKILKTLKEKGYTYDSKTRVSNLTIGTGKKYELFFG